MVRALTAGDPGDQGNLAFEAPSRFALPCRKLSTVFRKPLLHARRL